MDCTSVAAACFDRSERIPCTFLGIVAQFSLMVTIPYIFRQNERTGFLSVRLAGCIVAYTALDAATTCRPLWDTIPWTFLPMRCSIPPIR